MGCKLALACADMCVFEHATGSIEEWEQWKESVRVNSRKPLGVDMQRRRYWALGGRASAWRIYVEEDEGASWGWYEGALADFPIFQLRYTPQVELVNQPAPFVTPRAIHQF